jgi:hypothetical protein
MFRRLLLASAAGVVAVSVLPAAAGSATARSTPSGLAPTSVVHVRPVNKHGHTLPGYTITNQRPHAHCIAGAEATGNSYRCFSGNKIVEPCWAQKPKRFAVCLRQPWSFRLVQLKVTGGYSGHLPRKPNALPWGVQLANGEQCLVAEGASGVVRGKRINYFCAHTHDALYGKVHKHHPVWRIRKAKPTGGGHYQPVGRVGLTKAWFGKRSRQA